MKPALRAVVHFIQATSSSFLAQMRPPLPEGMALREGGVGRHCRRGRRRERSLPEGKAGFASRGTRAPPSHAHSSTSTPSPSQPPPLAPRSPPPTPPTPPSAGVSSAVCAGQAPPTTGVVARAPPCARGRRRRPRAWWREHAGSVGRRVHGCELRRCKVQIG
jgi:hypothetical protein